MVHPSLEDNRIPAFSVGSVFSTVKKIYAIMAALNFLSKVFFLKTPVVQFQVWFLRTLSQKQEYLPVLAIKEEEKAFSEIIKTCRMAAIDCLCVNATKDNFIEAMSSNSLVVHFSGHATDLGLYFEEGLFMRIFFIMLFFNSVSDLCEILKPLEIDYFPKLVVLSACCTYDFGTILTQAGVAHVLVINRHIEV